MSSQNNFSAGTAKVCINPALGSMINGDFVVHYATKIHDDLFAKSLFLSTDQTSLLLIVVDICSMDLDFVNSVKTLISNEINISQENILISSTHTHASGSIGEVYLSPVDSGYRKFLASAIAQSAIQASQQTQAASVAYGSIDAPEHVLCRRYNMTDEYTPINPVSQAIDQVKTNPIGIEKYIIEPIGQPDPQVSYLGIKNLEGKWISVFANYSLHYVGDWENGTISADYYGYFSKYLADNLDTAEGFVAMMSNGTSGDINIWDFQGKLNHPQGLFEKSELIGNDLASKIIDQSKDLEWDANPELNIRTRTATFNLRKPNAAELKKAEQIIGESDYETYEYNDANLKKIYAREQSLLYQFPESRTSIFQMIKIGQTLIGTLPGEFFAETGLWLKAQAKDCNYFTVGIANDNIGYVPPKHEMEKGGYETWRSRYSCLEENAESETRKIMLQLIEEYS